MKSKIFSKRMTLEQISSYSNEIIDITHLANLKSLKKIGMYENNVVDISSLPNLSNLTYVELLNHIKNLEYE